LRLPARPEVVHVDQPIAQPFDELGRLPARFFVRSTFLRLYQFWLVLNQQREKVVGALRGLVDIGHGFPFVEEVLVELHILSALWKPPINPLERR